MIHRHFICVLFYTFLIHLVAKLIMFTNAVAHMKLVVLF